MKTIEVPVRVKLEPQRLVQVIGGIADALDKGQRVVASHLNSIVLRYLPEALRDRWTASFNAALQQDWDQDTSAPFACLMTHVERWPDPNAWRQVQRAAISTLLAHDVKLDELIDESSSEEKLFLPTAR